MERERPGFFTGLMAQQKPRYMWIGCSDSRVPANQITGLEPGEVFVHRNVANVVVHSAQQRPRYMSIQFAVGCLGRATSWWWATTAARWRARQRCTHPVGLADLNCLSTIRAVDQLKVEHLMVVGHYGCGGVQAALEGVRVGLADNWLRHIKDVRDRHRIVLDGVAVAYQHDVLCELNVIEQVMNVAQTTVLQDAWDRGQKLTLHGWVYGLKDGLLQDLHLTVAGNGGLDTLYRDGRCRCCGQAAAFRLIRGHHMFPQRLDSPLAYDIAKAMMDGFNRHYRLFRTESARAKHRFETADWHGQQRAQRERIEFYDLRVKECSMRLEKEFKAGAQPMDVWQQVKLHYIGLLVDHHQPELAETFFNSVTTKILHRSYFQNDFIFVRPAVSTEYIENDEPAAAPTYRAYYPARDTLLDTIVRIIDNFRLQRPFDDLPRDAQLVLEAMSGRLVQVKLRANFQIQVLSSLFYRNKGAYVVGKIINGFNEVPFALPILHNRDNKLVIDACLFGEDDLQALFSFARAYFMVDMEVPSAYVQFLRSLMPRKPRNEIYNALGLAKQGKTLFYRDFLYHLRHSTDKFRIAPGIKGMVMLVFDLPSFPYVFKLIKDYYPPQKDTTREQIKGKYLLVKQHDRVGRMADTLEYSEVAFPRDRFDDELIAEIQKFAPSQLEISDRDGDGSEEVIIKHLYIERRMIPLNIYLQEAFDAGPDDERGGQRRSSMRWWSTATPSRTWWRPTSSLATCCGRTLASPATARWCSTTTTRSNTSPTATSARCPRRATRKKR